MVMVSACFCSRYNTTYDNMKPEWRSWSFNWFRIWCSYKLPLVQEFLSVLSKSSSVCPGHLCPGHWNLYVLGVTGYPPGCQALSCSAGTYKCYLCYAFPGFSFLENKVWNISSPVELWMCESLATVQLKKLRRNEAGPAKNLLFFFFFKKFIRICSAGSKPAEFDELASSDKNLLFWRKFLAAVWHPLLPGRAAVTRGSQARPATLSHHIQRE